MPEGAAGKLRSLVLVAGAMLLLAFAYQTLVIWLDTDSFVVALFVVPVATLAIGSAATGALGTWAPVPRVMTLAVLCLAAPVGALFLNGLGSMIACRQSNMMLAMLSCPWP